MKRSRIDALPLEVRRWLEQSLSDSNFSGYALLPELLREKGYVISRSSIHRYGQKMERRMAAIRASTDAARMLTEGAPDDQDARSEGIIAMIQSELFESISNLLDAGDDETTNADRVDLLSRAAKNIAALSRASVNQKRFRMAIRDKLAALEKNGAAGGRRLDAETLKAVREALYG